MIQLAYSVEENAAPRLTLSCEKVRELDWQDDGLLERLLGLLETGHIVPLDIRRLAQDRPVERRPQLLFLLVLVVVVALFPASERQGCRENIAMIRTLWRHWR